MLRKLFTSLLLVGSALAVPVKVSIPHGKPDHFKGVNWKVTWFPRIWAGAMVGQLCGYTDVDKHAIQLSEACQKDGEDMPETLLHEIHHAIQMESGNHQQKGWDYHQWIYLMSPRLAWTLRHNPEVVTYLLNGK